jgi:hypothetical protein
MYGFLYTLWHKEEEWGPRMDANEEKSFADIRAIRGLLSPNWAAWCSIIP